MNTQEGNKLIAEFMEHDFMKVDYLRYHKSWDWLVPVVEKIGKFPETYSKVTTWERLKGDVVLNDIQSVWNNCIKLIQHYNKQHKNNSPWKSIDESPYLYRRKEICK